MCVCVCTECMSRTVLTNTQWMDGCMDLDEGNIRGIKGSLRSLSSILYSLHEVCERPLEATSIHLNSSLHRSSHTQPIRAQTSSGKLKTREAAGNHLGDLGAASHLHHHALICILAFHPSLQSQATLEQGCTSLMSFFWIIFNKGIFTFPLILKTKYHFNLNHPDNMSCHLLQLYVL